MCYIKKANERERERERERMSKTERFVDRMLLLLLQLVLKICC